MSRCDRCPDCGADLPTAGDYFMPCETPACKAKYAELLRRNEAHREREAAAQRHRAAMMELIGAGLACGVATNRKPRRAVAKGSKKTGRNARVIGDVVYRQRKKVSR